VPDRFRASARDCSDRCATRRKSLGGVGELMPLLSEHDAKQKGK
jgi:hypothetical protein